MEYFPFSKNKRKDDANRFSDHQIFKSMGGHKAELNKTTDFYNIKDES